MADFFFAKVRVLRFPEKIDGVAKSPMNEVNYFEHYVAIASGLACLPSLTPNKGPPFSRGKSTANQGKVADLVKYLNGRGSIV